MIKPMKKLVVIFGTFFAFFGFSAHGQIYQMYQEGFEAGETPGYTVTTGATYSYPTDLYSADSRSIKLVQRTGGDIELVTDWIDFSQNMNLRYIVLEFDHICNVNPLSVANSSTVATIWVKRYDQSNWTLLGDQYYAVPGGPFGNGVSTFSRQSYYEWGEDLTLSQSSWKHERFEINTILNNVSQNNRKLQFRFVLSTRVSGAVDGTGWWLDALSVVSSHEPISDPRITMLRFPDGGAYANSRGARVQADIIATTASGLNPDSVYITYSVGHEPGEQFLQMSQMEGYPNRYEATIPFFGYDTLMRFHVVAKDASQNENTATYPASSSARIEYYYTRGKYNKSLVGDENGLIDLSVVSGSINFPFGNNRSGKDEYVYPKALMEEWGFEPGSITSISYKFFESLDQSLERKNFKISMKNAPPTHAINASKKYFSTEMQTVYYGDYIIPATAAYAGQTIELTDTFYYSGNDLIVQTSYFGPTSIGRVNIASIPVMNDDKRTLSDMSNNNIDPANTVSARRYDSQQPFFAFESQKNLPLYHDAGVDSIVYPNFETATTDSPNEQIRVRLRNFGVRTLNAVRISYSVDGGEVHSYDWTGNLGANETEIVTITNTLHAEEGFHSLVAWVEDTVTSGTQRIRDHEPYNDTTMTDFISCAGPMHGVVTIGPSGDYSNMEQFLFVVSRCGVDSILNVDLAPGVYGSFTMPAVNGLSPNAYINFRAIDGGVTFLSSPEDEYLVDLSGVHHIHFEGVEFVRSEYNSLNMLGLIKLETVSSDCHFVSCVFADSAANQLTQLIHSGGADSLTFVDCYFYRGQVSLSLTGEASDNRAIDNYVHGCTFMMPRFSAIEARYQTGVVIDSNYFEDAQTNDRYLLRLQQCDGASKVTANSIYITQGAGAIGVSTVSGTAANRIVVANNMIEVKDDGSAISQMTPMNIMDAEWVDVVYNSVKFSAPTRNNVASVVFGAYGTSLENSRLLNNVIVVFDESNYALSFTPMTSTTDTVGHNIYYTGGPVLNRHNEQNCANMNQWRLKVPADSNSIIFKPDFLNAIRADLRTYNRSIKGIGVPVSTVTTDMFGTQRDVDSTCAGAFEFSTLLSDFTVSSLYAPLDEYCAIPDEVELIPSLRNIGVGAYDSDTSGGTITIYCKLNGEATQSCVVNGLVGAEDSIAYSTGIMLNMPPAGQFDSTHHLKIWVHSSLDPNPTNDTNEFEIISRYHASAPTGYSTTIPYGDSVLLTANQGILQWPRHVYISGDKVNSEVYWFTSPDDENPVARGANYQTPSLREDMTYYIEQRRSIPLLRITQIQIRKANAVGLPASLPYYYSSNTLTAVMLTNVGSAPANIRDDQLRTVSTNESFNNKRYTFPNITVAPGQSIVVQWAKSSASDSPDALIAGDANEITQMPVKTDMAFLYYHNGVIDDAVALNNITSKSVWTSLQVPQYIWAGSGIAMPSTAPAGIIRDAWPDPNATPANSAGFWVMASNDRRLTPGVSDSSLFLYAENGCRGELGQIHVNLEDVPLSDIEIYDLEVSSGCSLGDEPITVKVNNFGIQRSDTVFIHYTTGEETYCDTIAEGVGVRDEITHTFTHLLNMSRNSDTVFNIKVWVDSADGDIIRLNDTVSTTTESYFTLPAPTIDTYDTIEYAMSYLAQLPEDELASPVWYDRNMNKLASGNSFTSGLLYMDDTFYVSQQNLKLFHGKLGDSVLVTSNREPRYPNPWQSYYLQSKAQYIVTARELSNMGLNPGYITAVSFYLDEIRANKVNTYTNFVLSIGATNDSVFNSTTDWKPVSDVYSNRFSLTTSTNNDTLPNCKGWIRYEFDTPFMWDGVSNVVLQDWHIVSSRNTNGVSIGYNTTTNNMSLYATSSSATTSIYGSTDAGTSVSNSRPSIKFDVMAYSCESEASPIYVTLTGIPDTDATVMWLSNTPSVEISSCATLDVSVRNLGRNTISGYKLYYSVDDSELDSTIVSGITLAPTQVDTLPLIPEPLLPGRHYVKAYIVVEGDSVQSNDTIESLVNVSFCPGDYTIGTGEQFATFTQAIDTMNLVGISGPVTFNVMPDTYREQIVINNISGNSDSNIITFKALGDGVLITSPTSQARNYAVRVVNSDGVVFDGIGIRSQAVVANVSENTYANAVVVDTSNNIKFENCKISVRKGNINNVADTAQRAFASGVVIGSYVTKLELSTTTIDSGYYSVTNRSGSAGINNLYIHNCKMSTFLKGGVIVDGVTNFTMENDTLKSAAKVNGRPLTGVWLTSVGGKVDVNTTQIYLNDTWQERKVGLRLSNVTGTQRQPVNIVNNMIGVCTKGGTRPTPAALYIDSSSYINVYFNTLNVDGLGQSLPTTHSLFVGKKSSRVQVMNNILANHAQGYAYEVEKDTSIATSNYNAFYSTADTISNKIVYYGKQISSANLLNSLQTQFGTEQLSIVERPYFIGEENLHLVVGNMRGKALYNSDVPRDIDGTMRPSMAKPSIGAHEMTAKDHDVSIVEILNPVWPKNITQPIDLEGDTITVHVTFYNNGDATERNVTWYAEIVGRSDVYSTSQVIPTFPPQTFAEGSVSLICPIGLLDTQYVRVTIMSSGDEAPENNARESQFYLAPAFNLKAVKTIVHDVYRNCYRDQTPVTIIVKNSGYRNIPANTNVTIGFQTRMYTADVQVPNIPAIHTENVRLSRTLLVGPDTLNESYDTINFVAKADLSPRGLAMAIQTELRSWVSYSYDRHPENDTSEFVRTTSDYKPTPPQGNDGHFPYGTWGNLTATQAENWPIRWYRVPDTSAGKEFWTHPSPVLSWTWGDNADTKPPQYFRDSTYYLICMSNPMGCWSDFSEIHAIVNPRVEKDIAIEAILSPTGNRVYMEDDTVRVRIANYGTMPQSNIPIVFKLMNRNGTNEANPYQTVKEFYSGTIQPGDTLIYTFTELAKLSAAVSTSPSRETWFSIKAYTELPGDMTLRNDTIRNIKQFMTYGEDIYCSPVFNEVSKMNITRISFGSLDLNLPALGRTYSDRIAKYSAINNYVIPPIHVTRGMKDSIIIGVANNFTSSDVKTKTNVAVFVDWNRDGEFSYSLDTNGVYEPGSEVAAWGRAVSISRNFASTITIPNYASYGMMRMRVVMLTDTTTPVLPCFLKTRTASNGDIIRIDYDDVHIIDLLMFVDDEKSLPEHDVAITRMVAPYHNIIKDSIRAPKFTFANRGTETLDSVRFKYTYSYTDTNFSDITRYYTWRGSLPVGQSAIGTLPRDTFPTGTTLMTITALVPDDADSSNNTLWHEIHRSKVLVLAVADNFDDENMWYAPRGHSRFDTNFWQLGTPAKQRIDGAYSAPNAWSTTLNTNIVTGFWGSRSYLYSPVFDISQVRPDSLFFRMKSNMPEGSRMYVEFWNFDGYWSKMDHDSLEHWYNNEIPEEEADDPVRFFTGNNNEYELMYFSTQHNKTSGDFPELSQFRIVYETDPGTSQVSSFQGGVAIDDFALGHARRPIDVGVVAITYPTEPKYGQIIQPEVIVHNYGNDTIRSFILAYKPFGTNLSKQGIYTGVLPPDGEDLFKFDASFIVTSKFPDTFSICAYTNVNTDIYWENDTTCSEFYLAPLHHDIEMVGFIEPQGRVIAGDSVEITVRMYNFGVDSVYLTDVVYEFNGQPPVRETVNLWNSLGRPLRYREYFNYTFKHKVRTSLGIMSVKAYSCYSMDDYPFNDTITTSFSGVTTINDLSAKSVVIDTTRTNGYTVSLIIENEGARGANNFEVGMYLRNDTNNVIRDRYVRDLPLPALGTGYFMFNRTFNNRADLDSITAFVSIEGDNNRTNDTTRLVVPQYIDIAISKVLVVENRNDFCTVHAQIENRGTMVISGKTVTITATINGQTVTKTIMVEHMVPRQIYTIDFDDMVPKDWNRRYEGSGTVTMANDANAINNQTNSITVINYKEGIPTTETSSFVLEQNYPNPFRNETSIEFSIPNPGAVRFYIVDALGHIVQQSTDNYSDGRHTINVSMDRFPAGVYYYAIEFDGERQMRKMIVY